MDSSSKETRRAALCLLCAVAALFAAPAARAATAGGVDVIILMDASAMTSLAGVAADEPWLACPCLNPEHFYLKPASLDADAVAAGATFPAAKRLAAGECAKPGELVVYDAALQAWVALATAREYRFCRSFLAEEDAHGFQPWQYHFARDAQGELVHIETGADAGCFGRNDAAKALSGALASAVLAANEENRVAFCAFGEAGSSRWSCPLTDELSTVLACIDASPVQRGGDHAAGLARALRLLNRRPLTERLGRRAVVVLISGGEAFPAGNAQRALHLAAALKETVGAETPAVFGTGLSPEQRRGCGAEIVVIGLWDGGSAWLDALASGPDARFCLSENETAEAFASAVSERVFKNGTVRW